MPAQGAVPPSILCEGLWAHFLAAAPSLPTGTPPCPAQLLLPLLCWALASCCTGAVALQPPRITILRMPAEPPHPGENVTISCEAVSGLPELTLLYWLGNSSFVEKLHPDGAVHEGMVLEEPQGSGVVLHRDLHFISFSVWHLHTNFTCVVLSPLGVDTREVQWLPLAPAPAPTKSGGLGWEQGATPDG
ncbi:interleukin-18-binding protein [Falco peregrinus]|uniref:interleukin-18-binding protein n=2 Tax=Falco TaxID=8952 RepID=UPI0024792D17|nr:interleukin-18-binding protein [Falco peregrinus]